MPVFLSFVVMNEERFILAWNTPLPDAAFKLTIYLFPNFGIFFGCRMEHENRPIFGGSAARGPVLDAGAGVPPRDFTATRGAQLEPL